MHELQQGLTLFTAGQYELAIKAYDQLLEQQSTNSTIHFNKALALAELPKLSDAIESFNKAIEYNKDYIEAYLHRAINLIKQDNNQLAIEDLNRALTLQPDLVNAYYYQGIAFSNIGELTQAIEFFNKTLSYKPDFIDAFVKRTILLQTINSAQAEQLLQLQQIVTANQHQLSELESLELKLATNQTQNNNRLQALISIIDRVKDLELQLTQKVETAQKTNYRLQQLEVDKSVLSKAIELASQTITSLNEQVITAQNKIVVKQEQKKDDIQLLQNLNKDEVDIKAEISDINCSINSIKEVINKLTSKQTAILLDNTTIGQLDLSEFIETKDLSANPVISSLNNQQNYDVKKVEDLLKAELPESRYIKKVIKLTEKLKDEEVTEILTALQSNLTDILVIAVQTNDSLWHGLVLRDFLSSPSEHILKIIYCNPTGQAFNSNDHIKSLVRKFKEAYQTSQFIDLKNNQESQIEYSGPIIVENLVKLANVNFTNLDQEKIKIQLEKIGSIKNINIKHNLIAESNDDYSQDKIETLLKILLKDKDVGITPVTMFTNEQQLMENTSEAILNAINNNHPVVVPLQTIAQNWVGLVIKTLADQTIEILYINPQGQPLCEEENYNILVKTIANNSPSVSIIDLRLNQHYTNSDDGPRTIENIIKLATTNTTDIAYNDLRNILTTVPNIDSIRREHIVQLHNNQIPVPNFMVELTTDINTEDILITDSVNQSTAGMQSGVDVTESTPNLSIIGELLMAGINYQTDESTIK